MNRPGSNNSLPPWGALLVLLIMALAVFLHFKPSAPLTISELTPNNPVAINEAMSPTVPAAGGASELEPSATIAAETKTPVSLDPETARTAVHQVENGVYERATAMFEQEPVDTQWAIAYEQALREMFAQHQGLQRVSINSISCHTSMCRIEVFTPRDTDADFFTAMFYDALANFRAGELKAEAAITRRMEQGMTSVYVARKDHTLGFY